MQRLLLTILSQQHSKHQLFWVDYSGAEIPKDSMLSLRKKITDTVDQELIIGTGVDFQMAMRSMKQLVSLIHFRPGVTDNSAKSFSELLKRDPLFNNRELFVHSGVLATHISKGDFNPLIQARLSFSAQDDFSSIEKVNFDLELKNEVLVKEYAILKSTDSELEKLSLENCWALSLTEMKAIKAHFNLPEVKSSRQEAGLGANPTDVEIEMIAQTWSEHCKHKIFNATIAYKDSEKSFTVNSLFKEFIKNPTYALKKDWAISLFDDNAGIVRFTDGMDLCIKVETHNSPSALDPYGGALTGILGVNRDIMGTGLGAKPVANTNVFCVGMPDEMELPEALIHPRDILTGIHRGVMDGGNKSGIPTVNGAIYFDESYSGKPLVYCGTVGVIPPMIQDRDASVKGQRPNDLIVMVGGEVGIDGIHGATASSLVMDKNTTLGMVQIGDPFSQKRMLDFLLVARDKLLYNSLTDNGAGGLSSSVGEMAGATHGGHLNLDKVPLKYHGLLPWQILVSESQERMTLSVPKENWNELKELADLYQVSVSNVGEFHEDGFFTCYFGDKKVCHLDLDFLHKGCPKLELKATFEKKSYRSWKLETTTSKLDLNNHESVLKALLSHPSIASKEKWIRQYDHEVQGGTVVKPLEGLTVSSPNDAGVMWYGAQGLASDEGFSVASGICPHFSIDDTYLMTKLAVDEAVRNLICHGADPEKIALVDNFCWPDPTPGKNNPDAEFKLAQLVRSCLALKEMVETYEMPLVSGKDSMKNDYHGDKVKISVLPTLLVTALGHVPDVNIVPKSQSASGDLLYRVGAKKYDKYFGHYLHHFGCDLVRENNCDFDFKKMVNLYKKIFKAQGKKLINSAHDISEGGFMVALTETLMMNNLGIEVKETSVPYLYSELPGHFLISVHPNNKHAFESCFDQDECELVGPMNSNGVITVGETKLETKILAKFWRAES